MQSSDTPAHWSESDSQTFIDYGKFFVPAREKQAGIVSRLLKTVPDLKLVVDLCCGEGLLSKHILSTIPDCKLAAYDLSEAMLAKTQQNLSPFSNRFTTEQFDLSSMEWRNLNSIGAVVSSLAVHHLDGDGKKALFADLQKMLKPGGIFILIDLVMPTRQIGTAIAAQSWDHWVKQKVKAEKAPEHIFTTFKSEGWNFYDDPAADPIDQPSGLFEQMKWMSDAGFIDVDLFWMDAGHIVLGGWKGI